MSSCTDPLRLNELQLFKELKKTLLPKEVKDTRNILQIHDDILYVWNAKDFCINTLNLANVRGEFDKNIPHQTLQPTDPPIFEITNLLLNETVTQLALWGHLGIVLIELPKRWGKETTFQGGKNFISCATQHLDGCSSQLGVTTRICRAKWHPGSAKDCHLLVLTSENTFLLYECELGTKPRLINTWKVGPTPSTSPSKIPNIAYFEDIAVDFDFATPTLQKRKNYNRNKNAEGTTWNEIEWPILVLRDNGHVLMVRGDILSGKFKMPTVMGPLSMHPPVDDNYGVDSCSIICIQSTPPIVAIATCTGKIYHAILLAENFDDISNDTYNEKSWFQGESTFNLHPPDDALYVYECLELELGLFFQDNDKKYTCPIHLYYDKRNRSRYFCSHNAGIHVVNLPMVAQLDDYVGLKEDNTNAHMPSLASHSTSQYLVCTRSKHTDVKESTPLLGFGLLENPCVLIALLHTGIVVDITIVDLYYLTRIEHPKPITSPSKKVTREPFDVYIKSLLKHETSQPITKLGFSSKMCARESVELLMRATDIFRKENFVRYDRVKEEIAKKVRALKALKTHQLRELDSLINLKKELQQATERLAERYEDIKDEQEKLAKRAEEVLRLVNNKEPTMTPAERADAVELKNLDEKTKDLVVRLEQFRKRVSHQSTHLENYENIEKKKEIVLSKVQEDAIRTNLSAMGKEISQLMAVVKKLNTEVEP